MIRLALVALAVMACAGCDVKSYRNYPAAQVEDYAVCKAGGMGAYLNSASEVRCAPPELQP